MQIRIRNLVQELRKRSVIRALVAYGVVAWMLLQVADVTFDRLPIPENSMTVLIALVVTGFPVVAILAWAYELTARGIVRHNETDARAPRLAFLPFVAVVAVVAVGSGYLLYYLSQNFWESPRRSIAILPFTNSSGEAETEYFSDGLTEEIQSLIVRLNEFRVVALSTTRQFKDSVMDAKSIAERLGAEAVDSEFKTAFTDLVRKLIVAHTGDTISTGLRYLSKNNAYISRVAAIEGLFPNASVLVCFRHPFTHCRSLAAQHERFLAMHSEDAFARDYMKWIGHYDFGSNFRPIDFNRDGFGRPEKSDAAFWLRYWINDDQEAKRYFYGDDCVMCSSPWTNTQRKNWPEDAAASE